MAPGQAAVEPGAMIDFMIEIDGRRAQGAEQRRRPVGEAPTAQPDQYAGRIVPAVHGPHQRHIAEIAARSAEPARLHLGAQGAELLAHPGIDGGWRDRVDVGPTDAAILHRYRHEEGAGARAPAYRAGRKRPHVHIAFAHVGGIAIVIAIGIEHGVNRDDIRHAPVWRQKCPPQLDAVVIGIEAQQPEAPVQERGLARGMYPAQVDVAVQGETILGASGQRRERREREERAMPHSRHQ